MRGSPEGMRGNDNADAARRSQPAAAAMDRLRGSGVQSSSGATINRSMFIIYYSLISIISVSDLIQNYTKSETSTGVSKFDRQAPVNTNHILLAHSLSSSPGASILAAADA